MPEIVSIIFNEIFLVDFGVVHFLLKIPDVAFTLLRVKSGYVSDDVNDLVAELGVEQLVDDVLEVVREYGLAALGVFEEQAAHCFEQVAHDGDVGLHVQDEGLVLDDDFNCRIQPLVEETLHILELSKTRVGLLQDPQEERVVEAEMLQQLEHLIS